MSLGTGTVMEEDPRERYARERRLHTESMAIEGYGFRTSVAAARAQMGLRAVSVIAAVTALVFLFLGAGQLFALAVWLGVAVLFVAVIALILAGYRREVRRAEQELLRERSRRDATIPERG